MKKTRTRTSTIMPKKEIDRTSYERLKRNLENSKQQLKEIRDQLAAIRNNDSTNLAENSSFLYLIAQEAGKITEIENLQRELDNIVVVEKKKTTDLVDLGDCVSLQIKYSDETDSILKKYLLVGSSPNSFENEISQNSAIGKVIKGKPVGYSEIITLPDGVFAEIKIISKE